MASPEPDLVVQSADGTPIGVFVDGTGPPLVMVHGSIADHTTFDTLVEHLSPSLTTYRLDRRGFGASGDADDYALERDFEDVVAVINAAAEQAGGKVGLFGHSYGANCALGAAASAESVSALALFEPSLGLEYPPGLIDKIEGHIDAGEHEAAVVEVLANLLEMSGDEIDGYRRSPVWSDRLRAAHTVPRECRVEQERTFASINLPSVDKCPTLLLTGAETLDVLAQITRDCAAHLPGAEVRSLSGVDHMAHQSHPEMVAGQVIEFLRG